MSSEWKRVFLFFLMFLDFSVIVLQQSLMLDADGGSLSPGSKPHICEHCTASFRSSYHLRRHVLIHTGIVTLPGLSLVKVYQLTLNPYPL